MTMQRLTLVTLLVERPPEVRAWYERVLGLTPLTDSPLLATAEGETLLNFIKGEQADPEQIQLHFQVPDVDAAYAELAAQGVVFDAPPADMPWGWRHAYTKDPAGHTVELVAPLPTARFRLPARPAGVTDD